MIPEIGHFALILALCVAVIQSVFPLVGASRRIPGWVALARPTAYAQFAMLATAFGVLTWGFVTNDFSISYAAHNSNSQLPLQYRISAVWGGHEGSLLLWTLILSGWTVAVALFSRNLPNEMVARVISVMGMVGIGFLLFMLLTSNPFDRTLPPPPDGGDLNPLLQDFGLIVHPPLLYMGYVGFSVAFAFAIAALIGGRLDAAWARWSRPWTIIAWMFLTLGIALGSWWAYYELGWGGWWFWDPVENASFMPWLVGTALMHSLAVTEKRSSFRSWTVLLAIAAFSLSLLGTFLVRSGVLTSVHAFATDPARGLFILLFLAVVVGASLLLYALRAGSVRSTGQFELFSRETALLVNNVLLVVVTGTILLGTVYPLILEALDLGKISVGPPYFNSVFLPLMVPLAIVLGIGPYLRWKRDQWPAMARAVYVKAALSMALGLLVPLAVAGMPNLAVWLGATLAFWLALNVLDHLRGMARTPAQLWTVMRGLPGGYWGMTLAHLGVAIFIVGITMTSHYSIEKDVRMGAWETHELGGYTFLFEGAKDHRGPNYIASLGTVRVSRGEREVAVLSPEKRTYLVRQMPMTEAAIDPGLFRDIYVALGEPLPDGSWAVRLYWKPFVRWIWLGAIFMALGGIVATMDRRYRLLAERDIAARDSAAEGARA